MATFNLPGLHRSGSTAQHRRLDAVRAALWAVTGSVVILFIFFSAIGGVDPGEARAATITVTVLAVLWLAHAWRRLWLDESDLSDRADRERRGF